jgi:hypothetical protein
MRQILKLLTKPGFNVKYDNSRESFDRAVGDMLFWRLEILMGDLQNLEK